MSIEQYPTKTNRNLDMTRRDLLLLHVPAMGVLLPVHA
jgi:hypothetical protein